MATLPWLVYAVCSTCRSNTSFSMARSRETYDVRGLRLDGLAGSHRARGRSHSAECRSAARWPGHAGEGLGRG